MLVIGHRGAGAYSPHNSRQSMAQAIRMGADMIETDIRVTIDNVPVIHHDRETLWGPIDKLTWRELEQYPLANGEYILSLEEMLLLFGSKIKFNLEIKPIELDKLEPIIKMLSNYPLCSPLLSSFSIAILEELASLKLYEKALLIEKESPLEELLALMETCRVKTLNIYYPLLDEKLVKSLHDNNYQVIVWTDFISEIWNPLVLYQKAIALNCQGFITGKPNLLVDYLHFLKMRI